MYSTQMCSNSIFIPVLPYIVTLRLCSFRMHVQYQTSEDHICVMGSISLLHRFNNKKRERWFFVCVSLGTKHFNQLICLCKSVLQLNYCLKLYLILHVVIVVVYYCKQSQPVNFVSQGDKARDNTQDRYKEYTLQ